MKLSGQSVTVILADAGREFLALADIDVPDLPGFLVSVEESEDLGLWIRVPKGRHVHFVLLRWEYILGIDLRSGMGRLIGMKP